MRGGIVACPTLVMQLQASPPIAIACLPTWLRLGIVLSEGRQGDGGSYMSDASHVTASDAPNHICMFSNLVATRLCFVGRRGR